MTIETSAGALDNSFIRDPKNEERLRQLGEKIGGDILALGIKMDWPEVRHNLVMKHQRDPIFKKVMGYVHIGYSDETVRAHQAEVQLEKEEQNQRERFGQWKV